MKILVIGGATYIGSHMLKILAEKNMEFKLATDQLTLEKCVNKIIESLGTLGIINFSL